MFIYAMGQVFSILQKRIHHRAPSKLGAPALLSRGIMLGMAIPFRGGLTPTHQISLFGSVMAMPPIVYRESLESLDLNGLDLIPKHIHR